MNITQASKKTQDKTHMPHRLLLPVLIAILANTENTVSLHRLSTNHCKRNHRVYGQLFNEKSGQYEGKSTNIIHIP